MDEIRLDDCGCCATVAAPDSVASTVTNPPGASALAYRSGTHGTVLRRMLAAVTRELPALTVRNPDDPGLALLDAWATVADVVTFYQERIANEGFLRTATERRSVLELARAIGYELRPGVAASTYLAFTVEPAPGAPTTAVVPAGTKVRSIPGQDELPQTFETGAEITAAVERNALALRSRQPQQIGLGRTHVYLSGVDTGLRPGDAILVVGDERREFPGSEQWDFRILRTVEALPARAADEVSTTLVTWDVGLGMDHERPVQPAQRNITVYAFRLRAALFGHNAPDWRTMPKEVRERYAGDDHATTRQWPGFELPGPGEEPVIDLDAAYPAIGPGSWLVLRRPGYHELYLVERADLAARQDYGITGKTTRVRLDASEHLSWFGIRPTAVYTQTEPLDLADEPVTGPVSGPDLVLASAIEPWFADTGGSAGAPVIVTGVTAAGEAATEVAVAETVTTVGGVTTLRLAAPLSQPLLPASVRILANVVAATHGETVEEVLGSGDGTVPYQRFTLRRSPLTHVSAPTASGVQDTLVVRVDGVAWAESPSLFPLGPHDRGYVVRIGDDAAATVVFGDGQRGARLPTGQENVRATYRFGIGPEGNVRAGALSLLQQRPLGIREVRNPVPAGGGTAPEVLADARVNAPLTVMTLDRVVSLRDHEDFARAFGGVAKARAVALWGGSAAFVHVTVAAPDGAAVAATTLDNLRAAFDAVRDRARAVQIDGYQALTFRVAVAVLADPAYVRDDVHARVADALRAAYAFDRRSFGQPVTAAEAVTVVQGVPGVVAANLTALYLTTERAAVHEVLVAHDARPTRSGVVPAELLLVDPDGVTVTELAP
ncbi:MAG TPA: putative baseplate assembly protein [Pilimelia sp.]|nr:putative baseplate assembly protein [Pilimelia sp.]